eukprot:CAMPEP_0183399272 /NCGR_PEP_ID=MMETSP0370-20130417/11824_1 /TAXON_ID=268820 /ORGANISM="Peridinium aciculiferum, Strain PAER-2" /LENGTH=327 /DNA_ID=CAMNT_0025580401 /DNA_START=18 /DNA_END=1001 /DNA_ORIENTATION=-
MMSSDVDIPVDQGDSFEKFAEQLRALEQAYQVAVEEEVKKNLEDDVEKGIKDEQKLKDLSMKASEAWKDTCKVWSNINMKVISRSPGPHANYIWESAAAWVLFDFVEAAEFATSYLQIWGFNSVGGGKPKLTLQLEQSQSAEAPGHEEHGGHTWYMIDCHVEGLSEAALVLQGQRGRSHQTWRLEDREMKWRSPRRLVQLRECLHDPVKDSLGDDYPRYFGETPFAKHGAPRGTTQRLAAWLAKLTELVNAGTLPPNLLARTLVFLHGPPLPAQADTMVFSGEEGGEIAAVDLGDAAAVRKALEATDRDDDAEGEFGEEDEILTETI